MSQGSLFGAEAGGGPRWRVGTADLYVGPAGWSYPDWEGVVYPQPKPRGFRPATYLARWFNSIEVNSTFYRPPSPKATEKWARDVADYPNFLYTAKLYQGFTHERGERWSAADARTFRDGIAPLTEAGRLGALLVQFPWSFHYNDASRDRVRGLVDEFGELPLVVEVRSGEWVREEPLDFIRSLGVGFCNIDQPPIRAERRLRGNIPLTAHAFGPVGYLRLHGRNAAAWFAEDAGRDQRYDYLYGPAELDDIEKALGRIAEQVERMFVIANNHYRGQAVATGLELIRRAVGEEIEPPGRVGEMYDPSR